MKRTHIIGLIAIAVSMGILVALMANFSSSATFDQAAAQPGKAFKLTGTLVVEKPIDFDPKNPNSFSFYLEDKTGTVGKVVCTDDMPQEFHRAEEVVVKGKYENGVFKAHHILTKCPSKYEGSEIQEKDKVEG